MSNPQSRIGIKHELGLHGSLDCVADWRDPQELCLDLLDTPERVQAMLRLANEHFLPVFDHYDSVLKAHGQWMLIVLSLLGEYAISAVGPGPRALRHWKLVRERGLKTIAKIQAGNTWELSAVPYIPAVENVARQAENLRREKVDGLMLGWTLGGYPSPNLEAVAEVGGNPGGCGADGRCDGSATPGARARMRGRGSVHHSLSQHGEPGAIRFGAKSAEHRQNAQGNHRSAGRDGWIASRRDRPRPPPARAANPQLTPRLRGFEPVQLPLDVDGDGDLDLLGNVEEHYHRGPDGKDVSWFSVVWFENPLK